MRRLNVKLFLYLLAGLVLFSGTLFAVHRLQAGNISGGLLYQANQADKDGHPKQAARYLGRYLDFVPGDVEARARLGKTLADPRLAVTTRARERARFVLEQVLARDPDRHDVRRTLVKLALDAHLLECAVHIFCVAPRRHARGMHRIVVMAQSKRDRVRSAAHPRHFRSRQSPRRQRQACTLA